MHKYLLVLLLLASSVQAEEYCYLVTTAKVKNQRVSVFSRHPMTDKIALEGWKKKVGTTVIEMKQVKCEQ